MSDDTSIWDTFTDIGKYIIDPTGGLVAGGSDIFGTDAGDDFISAFTGGMTSEEKKRFEAQLARLEEGYEKAGGYVEGQYYGENQDKLEEIKHLEELLNDPYYNIAGSSAPGNIETRERLEAEIDKLKGEINESLKYEPEKYLPQTDYHVSGYDPSSYTPTTYDPTKITQQSESAWAALNPERFAAPEYEEAAMQDPSEAAKARADAEGLAAQRGALQGMQDIYEQGGLTAIDRARLDESRRRNEMLERASREAILADMERKGQSGSGVELASRLIGGQAAADRMAQEALGVESLAEQRKERALESFGGMGRDLAEDIYRRQFETGAAQDVVNELNTLGVRDVQEADRKAADEYAAWQRGLLQRDVDRITEADIYNADAATAAARFAAENQTEADRQAAEWQTDADKWLAEQQNLESQWGANTGNTARLYNTGSQITADQRAAEQAWNQMMGYNTQQTNLGNLAIGSATGANAITSSMPSADYGQLIRNILEFGKSGSELVMDPVGGMDMMGGGGSGGAAGGIPPAVMAFA